MFGANYCGGPYFAQGYAEVLLIVAPATTTVLCVLLPAPFVCGLETNVVICNAIPFSYLVALT